jgi:hypothetical protein
MKLRTKKVIINFYLYSLCLEGIRKEREDILLPVSEEILTNKQELDDLTSTISTLKGSNQELENPDGVLHELDFTKQDTKIGTLLDDLTQVKNCNSQFQECSNFKLNYS